MLGAVFLAITGGEALYADMGQFGRTPIRFAWFGLVLPALLLNYAGQTALLLDGGDAAANPFYHLAPTWCLYPLVALATLATVIASQAIISGAFSLTRQAMQLGWFPGLTIRQTSREEYGQIYVPAVNWTMMILTVALVVSFRNSDRLAGAYGTAVSTTMLLTTVLLYDVMRRIWRWPRWLALLLFGAFVVVDLAFFSANLLKISEGGWVPLLLALIVFTAMTTWHAGIDTMHRVQNRASESARDFLREIEKDRRTRVPRTAVFLTRLSRRVPPAHPATRSADRRYSADIRRLDGEVRRPPARAERRPRRMAAARAIVLARHFALRIFRKSRCRHDLGQGVRDICRPHLS